MKFLVRLDGGNVGEYEATALRIEAGHLILASGGGHDVAAFAPGCWERVAEQPAEVHQPGDT